MCAMKSDIHTTVYSSSDGIKYSSPGFVDIPTNPKLPSSGGSVGGTSATPISPGNVTISMNRTELEGIISKLNNAKQEIESIWKELRHNDVEKIRNSWAGKDCEQYIMKFDQLNVHTSFAAVELLVNAYTKALTKLDEMQNENMNIIGTL